VPLSAAAADTGTASGTTPGERCCLFKAPRNDDLSAAFDVVKNNRLAFWDAMLWAAAQRAGVRYLVTEDLQDGFELAGVKFVNPFEAANNRLIDEVLPPG
jgi:hypothetical protein